MSVLFACRLWGFARHAERGLCLEAEPSALQAQTDQETIERALAAAPARARDDATVIRWNDDHTYDTLKEGSDRLVCYDPSSEARRAPFDVQCTSVANLPRVAQNRTFRAESADRQEENALVEAAEADGTRIAPEYGSLWISMRGDDQAGAGIHTTIAVPGATSESTGFPTTVVRAAPGSWPPGPAAPTS